MRTVIETIGLVTIVCLTSALAHAGASAIALDAEPGRWQARTELLYDVPSRSLVRREVRVWDQHPSAHLVFAFAPEASNPFAGGPASGAGRLTWRPEAAPAYDPSAVVIDYQGALANGRPEGLGTERDRDGLVYEGSWQDGRPHGAGHLRTSAGADYRGQFRDGKAEGAGTFTDIDGETYVGVFHAGLREGLATTTLPNQVSYRSTWHEGVEIAASRKLRLAQLGKGAASPEQDIRIGVTLLEHRPYGEAIGYTNASQGQRLKIVPAQGVMARWKGTGAHQPDLFVGPHEDHGSFGYLAFETSPVRLSMAVQNRGSETIQIVGAAIKVDSSALANEPAVQIETAHDRSCGTVKNYAPSFNLQNYGLGAVRVAVIHFAFADRGKETVAIPDRSKTLGSFMTGRKVDFDQDLKDAGVDTKTLKKMAKTEKKFTCRSRNQNACLVQIRNSGLFGSLAQKIVLNEDYISVGIKGSLDYDWQDNDGAIQHRKSPFTTAIVLAQASSASECGWEGGETVPVAANPVSLKLHAKDYRLQLKFRDVVKSGRTARYNFSLQAAKSSDHHVSIVIQLADGREIASRPIDLTYFVPNEAPQN